MLFIQSLTWLLLIMNPLFDFTPQSNLANWNIVDDVVMGGRSFGQFELDKDGHGVFSGNISLENNGGFSSVRYAMPQSDISSYTKFVIRLKGDGKTYQFRAKANRRDFQSYTTYIDTSGDWETIEIPFADLYPVFRGRRLNMENFEGKSAQEIGFLFGNKKPESFKLIIDNIELK